jgi:hypothetical protein
VPGGGGDVVEGVKRVEKAPKSPRKRKQRRKQVAPTLLDLKIATNTIFDSVVLDKIHF